MPKSNQRLLMAARERREAAEKAVAGPPPMTLGAINTCVGLILRDLQLGEGSYRRSSAYSDYVAMEFACFTTDSPALDTISGRFTALCERHGWDVCRVTKLNNSVMVTLQHHNVVSSGDARMPL